MTGGHIHCPCCAVAMLEAPDDLGYQRCLCGAVVAGTERTPGLMHRLWNGDRWHCEACHCVFAAPQQQLHQGPEAAEPRPQPTRQPQRQERAGIDL